MPIDMSTLKPDEKAQWLDWENGFNRWRNQIFIVLWITYGAFYLCRVNFSIAIPGIMKETGWTKTQLGAVGTALFWAYAVGQFVHGQLVERFSSKHYLFIAIMLSALMNILVGPAVGLGLLAVGVIWCLNGFFQAGGWSNCIKTLSQWFPPKARGKRMGWYGACYQLGNTLSWLLAGYLIANYGWRAGFWVPALIFAAIGFIPLLLLKNRPEEVNLPAIEIYEQHGEFAGMTVEQIRAKIKPKKEKEEHAGFAFTLKQTVGNKRVWAVSWSFFFVDIIRYGFLLWAPTYMFEVQKAGIDQTAYKVIAIPLFGIAGAIFSGWASDRFFQSRRAPIAALLMGILGFLAIFFYYGVPKEAWVLGFLTLGMIGFCVLGTQVILIGAVPMDFGTRKAAGSAAGFIDFFGYIGAGMAGVFTGVLTDKWGWESAFWFWIISAFISSSILFGLWKYKPESGKYL